METVENEYYWQLLHSRVSEKYVTEAVAFFRRHGFEPVLIKGWSAAQLYPEPSERYFTDIDLVFDPSDYSRAVEVSDRYRGDLPIDLHRGMKHLDSIAYEDFFDNSRLIKCGEIEIRVPRPEDHLRILCVHWLNDGGSNRRRLWDVYHAVANRPTDFDWERCLEIVSRTRRKWIVCAIALAHKYLGLPIEDTPVAGKVSEIPGWMIKTIEKEWTENVILAPLGNCLGDRKRLWIQIKKRLPPNAIQATIEMEGEFDERSRIPYQVGDIFLRLKPSVRRIVRKILGSSQPP